MWIHFDPHAFTWIDLISHGLTWFLWIHLSSLEFICLIYFCTYLYIIYSILSKWIQVSPGGSKWTKSVQVNPNQSKWVHVNQSESKHACTGTWDPFHLGLDPGLALWILGWARVGRNSKSPQKLPKYKTIHFAWTNSPPEKQGFRVRDGAAQKPPQGEWEGFRAPPHPQHIYIYM